MLNLLLLLLYPLLGSMNQANFPEILTEEEENEDFLNELELEFQE